MANLWRRNSNNLTQEEDMENVLQNWELPRVPVNHIYKRRGIFESARNYEIKTTEKTVMIQGEYQEFPLLDRSSIAVARHQRRYDALHMGLVQVAVKPLTRNGMNKSVLVCLRDGRNLNFDDSRLAVAEFSLKNGPAYFNCYPSYSLSLKDPWILDALTLNLKIHGFNSENQNTGDIAVDYKVYYKVMIETFDYNDPKAKNTLSVGSTTFVETNLASNDIAVQQTTDWDSVEIPERWSLNLQ